MNLTALAVLGFLGIVSLLSQSAAAELEPNQAFSLTGTGFTLSQNSAIDSNIDMLFTITQVSGKTNFSLQQGTIVIDKINLDVSDLSGSLLKNGKLFRISFNAEDPNGNKYAVSMLGRLVDTISTDSIYTMTGTFTDSSNRLIKIIYVSRASEFKVTASPSPTKTLTVNILKDSADPSQRVYSVNTAGFSFNYFSEPRLTIQKGTSVTFVNQDNASHSLKSGVSNYFSNSGSFVADGRISSGEIKPGNSWTVTFDQPGFYRLYDENYLWMEEVIFVSSSTSSTTIGSNIQPNN